MIIKARIKAGKDKFSVVEGDVWLINVKSIPENNEANKEIINELSKKYSSVRIIKGLKSKEKSAIIGLFNNIFYF